ncbi:MAG: phosphoribosylanthranilate isomerase [Chitinophagales bacterium]
MAKIMACGSRDAGDIRLLSKAGVDAIGLITEVRQNLACNLSRNKARELQELIPPGILSVLVLTEENAFEICRLAEYVNPDIIQLHGNITPEVISLLKERIDIRLTRAVLVNKAAAQNETQIINLALEYLEAGADAILIDSSGGGKYGSTGVTVDFTLARFLRDAIYPRPLILAGGLNPDNVARALTRVKPYAVDVFTGIIEKEHLSPAKVEQFIARARSVDCKEMVEK